MKEIREIMGMPIVVEVVDVGATHRALENVFKYFSDIDEKFSTYKDMSEISKLNRREIEGAELSAEMQEVLALSEETKRISKGYFDIRRLDGTLDTSGLVKGWAIKKATHILDREGFKNFYIEAGGDIEVRGHNALGKKWSIGIRNPFNQLEIIKILYLEEGGVATSGTYERGQHIYNPYIPGPLEEIMSITVIGPDVYEADRFATAAFAMGSSGIYFIEELLGLEGYMIDKNGQATVTTGFSKYTYDECLTT